MKNEVKCGMCGKPIDGLRDDGAGMDRVDGLGLKRSYHFHKDCFMISYKRSKSFPNYSSNASISEDGESVSQPKEAGSNILS